MFHTSHFIMRLWTHPAITCQACFAYFSAICVFYTATHALASSTLVSCVFLVCVCNLPFIGVSPGRLLISHTSSPCFSPTIFIQLQLNRLNCTNACVCVCMWSHIGLSKLWVRVWVRTVWRWHIVFPPYAGDNSELILLACPFAVDSAAFDKRHYNKSSLGSAHIVLRAGVFFGLRFPATVYSVIIWIICQSIENKRNTHTHSV